MVDRRIEDAAPSAEAVAAATTIRAAEEHADRAPPAEGSGLSADAALDARLALEFELVRNAAYHEDRARHFDRLHRVLMFLVVASGTAAFAAVGRAFPTWTANLIAFVTTAAGLADLVFDLSGRARQHGALRAQTYALLGELASEGDPKTIRRRLIASYGEEPAPNGTVGALAYNVAMLALDRPREHLLKLDLWRRMTRHWRPDAADLRSYAELGVAPPRTARRRG